jgi:hypothetical protein
MNVLLVVNIVGTENAIGHEPFFARNTMIRQQKSSYFIQTQKIFQLIEMHLFLTRLHSNAHLIRNFHDHRCRIRHGGTTRHQDGYS